MSKKTLFKILIAEAVLAAVALVFVVVALWNQPLGPSLGLDSSSPKQGEEASRPPVSNEQGSTAIPGPTATPESIVSQIVDLITPPTPSKPALCNGPAVITILLIGSDSRELGYNYGLADSIRIIRVDFTAPSVMMVDIPRDIWVEIPGLSDHYNLTHGKINQAYLFGNPGMGYYDGPGEGPGLLARTLDLNFGVKVDHYLALDMKTFVNLVDTIGGIDIHVGSKIDLNEDRENPDPTLIYEPGDYHLDGAQALQLARNRVPTIFQRARYQTFVLNAIGEKLMQPGMFPLWPQVISQFTQLVQTDLSPSEISKLACLGQELTDSQITTVAFPDDLWTGDSIYDPYRQVNTFVLEADFNQVRAYMHDFMNGTWPQK